MLNSCNTCLKQVGVKKVNDLDADSISNTEDNSVLAERIGLPKKISLHPYGSQDNPGNIIEESFRRKASVCDRLGHEFCSKRTSIDLEKDNHEEFRSDIVVTVKNIDTEDLSMFGEDKDIETNTNTEN